MARIYSRSGKKETHWYVDEYLDYAKTNKSRNSCVRNEIVLRTFNGFAKLERLRGITPQLI